MSNFLRPLQKIPMLRKLAAGLHLGSCPWPGSVPGSRARPGEEVPEIGSQSEQAVAFECTKHSTTSKKSYHGLPTKPSHSERFSYHSFM